MLEIAEKEEELEQQSRRLSGEFHRPSADRTQEEVKGELRDIVAKHFEVRQERRRLELKRLGERLKRMGEVIKRREEVRDSIIDRRMSELIGVEDEFRF